MSGLKRHVAAVHLHVTYSCTYCTTSALIGGFSELSSFLSLPTYLIFFNRFIVDTQIGANFLNWKTRHPANIPTLIHADKQKQCLLFLLLKSFY